MSFFLRFFDFEKKKQVFFSDDYSPWLDAGNAPATAIAGVSIKTLEECKMSVFETDGTSDSIERIIVAKEAKEARLLQYSEKKQLYALLPSERIEDYGIEIDSNSLGTTADDEVNAWHRDLIHLNMTKIAQILDLVHSDGITWGLVKREEYCKLVKIYFDSGKLNNSKINDKYKMALNI